jgi:uncharacterized protein YdeI (YjbR/CyaY-like superfamily)
MPDTRAARGAPEPTFFATPAELRRWLARHHATAAELWVGFHKVHSGTPSVTWPEAVDEALCVGWIDGVRRSLDAARYMIRFTPRRATSTWSAVNVARVAALEAEGRMTPAGRAAYARRQEARTATYAYERPAAGLDADVEGALRAEPAAWAFFAAQPPHYRHTAAHRVTSAKRAETRARRLAELVACSARGERIPQLRRATRPADD